MSVKAAVIIYGCMEVVQRLTFNHFYQVQKEKIDDDKRRRSA